MKRRKRIVACILAGVMMVSLLAACGKTTEDVDQPQEVQNSEDVQDPEETTSAPDALNAADGIEAADTNEENEEDENESESQEPESSEPETQKLENPFADAPSTKDWNGSEYGMIPMANVLWLLSYIRTLDADTQNAALGDADIEKLEQEFDTISDADPITITAWLDTVFLDPQENIFEKIGANPTYEMRNMLMVNAANISGFVPDIMNSSQFLDGYDGLSGDGTTFYNLWTADLAKIEAPESSDIEPSAAAEVQSIDANTANRDVNGDTELTVSLYCSDLAGTRNGSNFIFLYYDDEGYVLSQKSYINETNHPDEDDGVLTFFFYFNEKKTGVPVEGHVYLYRVPDGSKVPSYDTIPQSACIPIY